jgi:F0F1-type ATP synthase assembly protein I
MDKDSNKNSNVMKYAGLATQMMAMLVAGVWLGWKTDKWIGWKFPLFLILFPLLALGLSLWQIIREFNKPGKR